MAIDDPAVGLPNTTMATIASSVPGRPSAACSPAVAAPAANTSSAPQPASQVLYPGTIPSPGPMTAAPSSPDAAAYPASKPRRKVTSRSREGRGPPISRLSAVAPT